MTRLRLNDHDLLKGSLRPVLLFFMLSVALPSPGLSQTSSDYRCGNGGDLRRIEIRFEDEQDQLPCRVIYRPETEGDEVGTVSWRGIQSTEQCQAQAREVMDRLVSEGWTCAADGNGTGSQDATPVAANAALFEVEPDLATADLPDAEAPGEESTEQQAVWIEPPDLDAPMPALTALLRSDLEALAETLDGSFKAEIVAYDDLNADDVEDALVLLTYDSPQPAYRQLLAAYLHDGEAYQLTATKAIASSSSNTKNATVDAVDQGIIKISLQAFEPGDQSCCPSGVRRMSLALRNLDLVEIDTEAPTR